MQELALLDISFCILNEVADKCCQRKELTRRNNSKQRNMAPHFYYLQLISAIAYSRIAASTQTRTYCVC